MRKLSYIYSTLQGRGTWGGPAHPRIQDLCSKFFENSQNLIFPNIRAPLSKNCSPAPDYMIYLQVTPLRGYKLPDFTLLRFSWNPRIPCSFWPWMIEWQTIKPTKLLHVLCDWSTISSIISQLSSTETHLTKFMTKSKLLSKHIPKTQFGCQPMKCFRTKTKKNYYYYLFFLGVNVSSH